MVFTISEVDADQLCGQAFSSFEALYAELNNDRRHQMRMDGPKEQRFIDAAGTTWHVTKRNHPAFPAVACIRVVAKNGRQQLEQHLWCRGTAAWSCDEFIAGYTHPFEWN
jgi:hypothetical protein